MPSNVQSLCRAMLGAAVGTFTALSSFDAAEASCSVPRFNWKFNETRDAVINADSGEPCNIKLTEGRGTIIKRIVVLSQPSKGSVSSPNIVNVTYRSRPGFQGQDSFVFGVVGSKEGVPGTAKVAVTV